VIINNTNIQTFEQPGENNINTMSSIDYDTESLLGLSMATSCYSEDSQPRICFDLNCTFPMGDMCKACWLDRAIRRKRVSKVVRVQQAKEWVEEINVQKFVMDYTGEVFIGGALDRDAELETEDEEEGDLYFEAGDQELEDQHHGVAGFYKSDESDQEQGLNGEYRADFTELISKSFGSDWKTHSTQPSTSGTTSSSTSIFSRISARSDLSSFLEPWTSDLFDRTLDGQMEDTIFVGGAEDDPSEEICPFCRSPVGDPKYQHLLRCQYAHEEQGRFEVLLRR
jgi:hypothetical protein